MKNRCFKVIVLLTALLMLFCACQNTRKTAAGKTTPPETIPTESQKSSQTGNVFTVAELKEKYPHFFGLSAENGLTVCFWEVDDRDYRCYLVSTDMAALIDNSFAYTEQESASNSEILRILDSYDISWQAVSVQPVINPLSEYAYTLDDEHKEDMIGSFWFQAHSQAYNQLFPPYDTVIFDIDNDGILEECILNDGGTSGIFSFTINVWQLDQEKIEYYYWLTGPYGDLSFEETDSGVKLRHMIAANTCDYAIGIRDGSLVLVAEEAAEVYKANYGEYSIPGAVSAADAEHNSLIYGSPRYVKRYRQTSEEQVQETINSGAFVNLMNYYQFYDGTWAVEFLDASWDHFKYQYKLELTGTDATDGKETTYIVLSNREDITFAEAWKATGTDDPSAGGFDLADAIIVAVRKS